MSKMESTGEIPLARRFLRRWFAQATKDGKWPGSDERNYYAIMSKALDAKIVGEKWDFVEDDLFNVAGAPLWYSPAADDVRPWKKEARARYTGLAGECQPVEDELPAAQEEDVMVKGESEARSFAENVKGFWKKAEPSHNVKAFSGKIDDSAEEKTEQHHEGDWVMIDAAAARKEWPHLC